MTSALAISIHVPSKTKFFDIASISTECNELSFNFLQRHITSIQFNFRMINKANRLTFNHLF